MLPSGIGSPLLKSWPTLCCSACLMSASSGCAVYIGSEGTCSVRPSLLGSQWNSSHMLWFGSFFSKNVLQLLSPPRGSTGYSSTVWYNLLHFWKRVNKIQIFQTATARSAPDTEYCGWYKDLTYGCWSPLGHLQTTNMQQEITSIPGTVSLGDCIQLRLALGSGGGACRQVSNKFKKDMQKQDRAGTHGKGKETIEELQTSERVSSSSEDRPHGKGALTLATVKIITNNQIG